METRPPIEATSPTAANSDERTLAILAHILTLVAGFIAPLVIWLVKKDESPFVSESAKESLNFQITIFIALMVCGVLTLVVIGLFLFPVVGITAFVLVIMATIRSSEGRVYRYPFNLRLIK